MAPDKSLAAEIEAVRGRLQHLMSQAHEQEKRHTRGGRHNAAAACASRKRALHDALKIVGVCHASPAFVAALAEQEKGDA
ncbi:hypothetical protein C0214_19405 [Methylobacterium sp. DM1]|nr:hypothetical protein C0214_19405 [Methylobacterium sp. DM1]